MSKQIDRYKGLSEDEIIKLEVERLLRAEQVKLAWTPDHMDSRPSKAQLEPILYLASQFKYLYVLGGNQSIPQGNFVSMADGSKKCISRIAVGDMVKVFDTRRCRLVDAPVIKKWNNGIKPVYKWFFEGLRHLESTRRHEMLQADYTIEGNPFYKSMLEDVEYVLYPSKYSGTAPNMAEKVHKEEYIGELQVYDLTVDHPDHNYICNGIIVGNSGKSNLEIRSLVWMAEESSPYWRRPTDHFCNNKLCGAEGTLLSKTTCSSVLDYECQKCGNVWRVWDKHEPLNILLVGEQLKNLQENLYTPRIKKLFQDPDEWEEDKLGSPFVQKVTNRRTGNSILFFPHGQGDEKARKAIQGYTVHAVFTDEQMPANVIEECQRRVDAKMGTFMMAFTMKFLDANVMRMMEAQVASGAAKMFKLSKLDNPVYAGSKDLILKQLAGLSEEKRNTVLYGDVSYGEDYIYAQVETSKIGKPVPDSYSTNWRHVEVIDPAVKSKAGRLVVAQDPHTKIWHVIKAQKISGMLHDKHLYEYIIKLRQEDGYRPVLSVSDDDAGFIGMARHHENPTKFIFPPHKRARSKGGKLFLIKQSVGCLMSGILHIDPKFTLLWDEIREYQWKEGSTTEVRASHKFHLVDTLHYFFDTLPEEEKLPERPKTWHEEILEANQPWSPPIRNKSNQLKKKPKRYIMTSGWHGLMR